MQIQAEVNSNELQLDLSVESPLIIPGLMVYVVADPKEVIIIDEDTENYPVHSIYGIALNRGDKSLRFEAPWNDTWEPIKHLERMHDKVQDFQFAVFEYLLNNFLLGELSSIEETWFSKFQELQMHPLDEITELESQEREKGRLQKRPRKSETLPKNIPMKKSTINVKDKTFCCRNCTKRYTTSSNLLRHANTVHRDTNASSNNSFNDQDVVVVISTLSANSSENTVDNRDLSSPTSESNCGEKEILLEQCYPL
ncbi:unnamed protein product [Allacma fusca]|uniref:C2H2-type domain-containing protein n=1 Tax=Allacma fusca TaxID=39272 RepID=A0A8J2KIR0_9HEXA|nr:unnamed protein product [Allacma fusca]